MVTPPTAPSSSLQERAAAAIETIDGILVDPPPLEPDADDEAASLIFGLVSLAGLVCAHPELATVLAPQLAGLSAGVLDIPSRAAVLDTAVTALGATVKPAKHSGPGYVGHVVEFGPVGLVVSGSLVPATAQTEPAEEQPTAPAGPFVPDMVTSL